MEQYIDLLFQTFNYRSLLRPFGTFSKHVKQLFRIGTYVVSVFMQQIIIKQRENVKNLESIGLFKKISTLCFCFELNGLYYCCGSKSRPSSCEIVAAARGVHFQVTIRVVIYFVLFDPFENWFSSKQRKSHLENAAAQCCGLLSKRNLQAKNN